MNCAPSTLVFLVRLLIIATLESEDSQDPDPGFTEIFPDRAGVPLSNGLEIRSLIERSLLCPTLHRCSQAELEAHIAGVAVCNSHAAQTARL